MTKIFITPSALLPVFDCPEGGNGVGERGMVCASVNALERRRELERIAVENKHLVRRRERG